MGEDYYERLANLRQRLEAAGEPGLAEELLDAERGSATSSEILGRTGVILERLDRSGEGKRLQLRGEIRDLNRLSKRLFKTR